MSFIRQGYRPTRAWRFRACEVCCSRGVRVPVYSSKGRRLERNRQFGGERARDAATAAPLDLRCDPAAAGAESFRNGSARFPERPIGAHAGSRRATSNNEPAMPSCTSSNRCVLSENATSRSASFLRVRPSGHFRRHYEVHRQTEDRAGGALETPR